ncbi:hypothetical protein L3V43_04805 [Pseudoalteromonas sp. L23]|uniref:hypothetical protein n=1 Tax=unclassified Pseudoalteromonas TaxID=194690 RepID=UPI001EF04EC8|nr:hypothetical protein [Pseudoalteromonas sp. B530]MCF7512922.1 hypothetical protein [Pseudoalteromonas sp. L7]MCF7524962.1 hypothetical protein [Pseudoalteromonas sp. L23]MCX2765418.1 hypothetical protein [Pseudoalteromonas sp. B530]
MEPGNILKIDTLNEGWRDKDSVMLHACFQLLSDCVEKEELLSGHTDWDADDKHRAAKKELEALYAWWQSHDEDGIPCSEEKYQEENQMLIRLIHIRWALWT